MGDGAGLARTRAGQHAHGPSSAVATGALLGVEPVEHGVGGLRHLGKRVVCVCWCHPGHAARFREATGTVVHRRGPAVVLMLAGNGERCTFYHRRQRSPTTARSLRSPMSRRDDVQHHLVRLLRTPQAQMEREGIEYTEVNIELDPESAVFVEKANGGKTRRCRPLLFADGSTLTTPSLAQVKAKIGVGV
ncbi:hypothetical protein GCM10020221_34910 [Streptomyces thioluteus]|uniref:Uncharacterized protein n=1 Tax=Streptomyces thioluteus TaxID=66431 RepID=A0ABP6JL79_STRTU